MTWTVDDIPDMSGRTVLITGATAGIGLEAARAFAERKAHLILACRNAKKMAGVASELRAAGANGVDELVCDLSDLDSVRSCAAAQAALNCDIDVLLLNAGLASHSSPTAQGYENIIGTNHLGHFLLTGLLMPRVRERIVVVSSFGHRYVSSVDWAAVSGKKPFGSEMTRYLESKLANLLFVEELNRRLNGAQSNVVVVGAHPGATQSDLANSEDPSFFHRMMTTFAMKLAQPTAHGAWSLLMAATDKDPAGAAYYGPSGRWWLHSETYGPPMKNAYKNKVVTDVKLAEECWRESEKLTGFSFTV